MLEVTLPVSLYRGQRRVFVIQEVLAASWIVVRAKKDLREDGRIEGSHWCRVRFPRTKPPYPSTCIIRPSLRFASELSRPSPLHPSLAAAFVSLLPPWSTRTCSSGSAHLRSLPSHSCITPAH